MQLCTLRVKLENMVLLKNEHQQILEFGLLVQKYLFHLVQRLGTPKPTKGREERKQRNGQIMASSALA